MVVVREAEVVINAVDRFTPAFEKINRTLANVNAKIAIQLDNSVHKALNDLNKKVTETTTDREIAVTVNDRASAGLAKMAASAKKVNEAMDGAIAKTTAIGTASDSAHRKSQMFLDRMKSGADGVKKSLEGAGGALVAFAASGAVAGFSWLSADSFNKAAEGFYDALEKKGRDPKHVKAFIEGAKGTGYTTESARLGLMDDYMKRMRSSSTEQAIKATEAIEKVYFKNKAYLKQHGIESAASFSQLLTTPGALGVEERKWLRGIGVGGGGQTGRMQSVKRLAGGIDMGQAMKEDPYQMYINRAEDVKMSIGQSLVAPMTKVLGVALKVVDVFESIPGGTKLMGWGVMATAAALSMSALAAVVPSVVAGFTMMAGALNLAKAKTAALMVAQKAHAVVTALSTAATLSLGGALAAVALPLVALGAVLALVAYKTGVFQKVWKALSRTQIASDFVDGIKAAGDLIVRLIKRVDKLYKAFAKGDTAKGIGEGFKRALGVVDALYKRLKDSGLLSLFLLGPVGAVAAIGGAVAGGKVQEKIAGTLKNLYTLVSTTFSPILQKAQELLKAILAALDWLKSLFSGIWNRLKDALGITKAEKKSAWEQEMAKSGVEYNEALGGYTKGGKLSSQPANYGRLEQKRKAYQEAPAGIAEQISGAFDPLFAKLGLTNGPTKAGEYAAKIAALEGYEPEPRKIGMFSIPGENAYYSAGKLMEMSPEERAKYEFNHNLDYNVVDEAQENPKYHLTQEEIDIAAGKGGQASGGVAGAITSLGGQLSASQDVIDDRKRQQGLSEEQIAEEREQATYDSSGVGDAISPADMFGSLKKAWGGLWGARPESSSTGSDVVSSGLVRVHAGEPIVPAKLARPGKLNALLERVQQAPSQQASKPTSLGDTTVNVTVNNPSIKDQMDVYRLSDVLKRELEPYIEQVVKRKVGQFIT